MKKKKNKKEDEATPFLTETITLIVRVWKIL